MHEITPIVTVKYLHAWCAQNFKKRVSASKAQISTSFPCRDPLSDGHYKLTGMPERSASGQRRNACPKVRGHNNCLSLHSARI